MRGEVVLPSKGEDWNGDESVSVIFWEHGKTTVSARLSAGGWHETVSPWWSGSSSASSVSSRSARFQKAGVGLRWRPLPEMTLPGSWKGAEVAPRGKCQLELPGHRLAAVWMRPIATTYWSLGCHAREGWLSAGSCNFVCCFLRCDCCCCLLLQAHNRCGKK